MSLQAFWRLPFGQCLADLNAEHDSARDGPFLHYFGFVRSRESNKELIINMVLSGMINVNTESLSWIQPMESLLLLRGVRWSKERQNGDILADVKLSHYLWKKGGSSYQNQLVCAEGGVRWVDREGL